MRFSYKPVSNFMVAWEDLPIGIFVRIEPITVKWLRIDNVYRDYEQRQYPHIFYYIRVKESDYANRRIEYVFYEDQYNPSSTLDSTADGNIDLYRHCVPKFVRVLEYLEKP